MLPKVITSLQHPFIKLCIQLRDSKKHRQQHGQVLVFGKKVIQELSAREKPITLVTTAAKDEHRLLPTFQVTEAIMHKLFGSQTQETDAAIFALPSFCDLTSCNYLAVFDRVQDPGNMGTLIRTAAALGWDGALLISCCDPFNDKALRAAKGATFHLPLAMTDTKGLQELLHKRKRSLYIADLGGPPFYSVQPSPPLALIAGHEGSGPSSLLKALGSCITIPMHHGIDSLNVSAAAAILFHHFRQGH